MVVKRETAPPKRPTAAALRRKEVFKKAMLGRCFNCLASDHTVKYCRDPTRCWRCRRSNHISSRCFQRAYLPHVESQQTGGRTRGSRSMVILCQGSPPQHPFVWFLAFFCFPLPAARSPSSCLGHGSETIFWWWPSEHDFLGPWLGGELPRQPQVSPACSPQDGECQ
jgi:hypothetical protein